MTNNLEEPFDDEEFRSREAAQTRDTEERTLWEASQKYMAGKLTVEELEEYERTHTVYLKKAIISLAPRIRRKPRPSRKVSEDDRERYLWMVSRWYMAGDLTVEQLERNEVAYTERFNKAMVGVARWTLWHNFLNVFRINKRSSSEPGRI